MSELTCCNGGAGGGVVSSLGKLAARRLEERSEILELCGWKGTKLGSWLRSAFDWLGASSATGMDLHNVHPIEIF